MFVTCRRLTTLVLLAFIAGANGDTGKPVNDQQQPIGRIYHGGNIITMDDSNPQVEAVAVRAGRIVAVGDEEIVRAAVGNTAEDVDLAGATLVPGFIDAHGHIAHAAVFTGYVNVASPPVGEVKNISQLQATLQTEADKKAKGEWIIGYGYDDSLLAEGRHPKRFDLDKVSEEHPIFLFHVSGHLGVCNSRCLAMAGIEANTVSPPGGVIRRHEGTGDPSGIVEEQALKFVFEGGFPQPSFEDRIRLLQEAQTYYASYGLTTAQDAATTPADLAVLTAAAKKNKLFLDIVAYPFYTHGAVVHKKYSPSLNYKNGFRVGGIKLLLDGSPQGKTAWLSEPYHVPPPGESETYQGYPAMEDEELQGQLKFFYELGWQVQAHANGDAAIDQLLRAEQAVVRTQGCADRRTVIIHAQTMRDDQLHTAARLSLIPSFFIAHTYYWGDWHRDSVLGDARAARISPLRSAAALGIPFTLHNDTPIVPPDMMLLLWSAAARETRSGAILGPEQRIDVASALRAITIDAAHQLFEENDKGSLEPGKLADLVVLDRNPLEVNPSELRHIKVLSTIKEGRVVFQR